MVGIKGIDHINMRVKNLKKSVEFYRKNFGFEVKEDHAGEAEEPWVILGLPGAVYLCLYEHPEKKQRDDALRISHFGFALEDFDQAMMELLSNGVKFLYGGPVNWPRSRSLYIEDPSGHEIELSEKFGGGLN